MRAVVAGAALGMLAGCFGPNLGDAPFMCGTGGVCPDGYHCQQTGNLCVRDGAADAGILCTPRAFLRCDGSTFVACNATGDGETRMLCAFKCNDQVPQPRCEQCDPTQPRQCMGANNLVTCASDGSVTDTQTCPGFCNPGLGTPQCAFLSPSNLAGQCDAPGAGSLRIAADRKFDTDLCLGGNVVSQSGGTAPSICVLKFVNFQVDAGIKVTAGGGNALAIIATGTMTLNGILDVSGVGVANGPGVTAAQPMPLDGTYLTGGGGGGFATDGAAGGTDTSALGAGGGKAFGMASLVPLFAGMPGGNAGTGAACTTTSCAVAHGGGGGGALELVACSGLVVGATARINAAGGGGGGGFSGSTQAGGGGGGGAGGSLLIEAPMITLPAAGPLGATVTANGAGGGGGAELGGGLSAGRPGSDGQLSGTPAPGGHAGADGAGKGGDGGTRGAGVNTGSLPLNGQQSTTTGFGAGGGGGAAGRIRLNTRSDVTPTIIPGAIVSPDPSIGTIASHT